MKNGNKYFYFCSRYLGDQKDKTGNTKEKTAYYFAWEHFLLAY